ncbi:RidA family protein [Streptomyces sp. B-S-A8]|uniref:RidA family protein n=1 Tax=Streptomyces solicavernae TaxID=3043614 RepID=A0ABT6RU33_9ACTN|nr:RidA family protein [Streptomyces sp. B-S-A8]MDI3387947.1 RidA family protein [Streptomyces sp. B-S-A8]
MTTHDDAAGRELITLDSTPATAPYSAAVALGHLVWTSGALPTQPDGTCPADFDDQVRAALANLESQLNAAGADWSTVLKINGYVSDIERLPELNKVYEEVVNVHGKPARTTVEVSRFRGHVRVEFEAVAYRRQA